MKDSKRDITPTARTAEPAGCPYAAAAKAKRQSTKLSPATTFDPVRQKIDVTGDHAFQPPKPGDQRGPCPGLNALANHGYLDRNGITTVDKAVAAIYKVYGGGYDLGRFLAGLAIISSGDGATGTWSIGGRPVGDHLSPPLSLVKGISGTHNRFECDSSPTRGDAYINNGDATTMQMERFKALYELQPEGPSSNYNLEVWTKHRRNSYNYSINENPHYFNPPLGIIVSQAAHVLPAALMSNHSAEAPDGFMTGEVLKSFFAVSGTSGNLTYNKGHERIPDNWYRREIGNDYTIIGIASDIIDVLKHVPEAVRVGGNTGKPNSFTGIDLAHLSDGLYNPTNLLEGNNLACFVFQRLGFDPIGMLGKSTGLLSLLGCPELSQIDGSVYGTYPGVNDKSH
ncbi:hypothetical protein FRC07_009049 [Ceratobasidium sp. 392]|nr:hypothetical protein FRC07_009049 [Ceratobasidium sp. 392]